MSTTPGRWPYVDPGPYPTTPIPTSALTLLLGPKIESAALSDTDVTRIASAVADELERRAASPLRVTEADVRRWMGGRR